jgi:uncharacterized membrane protein
MKRFRPSGLLDWTFQFALIFKALDGVLEVAGGLVLLFVSPQTLQAWVHTLTQHELSEDPHDFLFSHLVSGARHLTDTGTTLAALYLLSHGIVKIVLVGAVLLDQLWAYPWMIGFLVLFIVYQLYLLVLHFTWGVALLTAFDAFIVWLTWREYGKQRVLLGHSPGAASPAVES